MSSEETLLTNLCAICHLNAPKYRCPRCSTRTCSLPCTRRHKLWSQCSGIRDPAAYLRRSELATEAAFDRDFNFITGIERRIERAERDAENRGVNVSAGAGYRDLSVVGLEHEDVELQEGDRKRKRGPFEAAGGSSRVQYLVKGEAGFLRRAQEAGVKVIKAPRGMSRSKLNGSKWHQKHKCLHWTVEWITDDGRKRMNCGETCRIADAYDRAYPVPKEERERERKEKKDDNKTHTQTLADDKDQPPAAAQPAEQGVSSEILHPQSATSNIQERESASAEAETPANLSSDKITAHRDVYFYLHRPRTTTKLPVLIPLAPDTTLTSALRSRVVVEFPTIYVLRDPIGKESPDKGEPRFILEEEYMHTHGNTEPDMDEVASDTDDQPLFGTVDIGDIDEGEVLEVLKKDLLDIAPGAETSQ